MLKTTVTRNQLRELALFTGIGGGILASKLLGWRTRCGVEINTFCTERLLQRQAEGHLERFPVWSDIRTFNGKCWFDEVEIISGGFPCQDISSAGSRAGLAGNSSGLWFEMCRIISEARPCYVFIENSPDLPSRGLGTILCSLAAMGYDARWGVLGAGHVGAPHKRKRTWLVASHPDRCRERKFPFHAEVVSASAIGADELSSYPVGESWRDEQRRGRLSQATHRAPVSGEIDWWHKLRFAGVDAGSPTGVERTRATGNSQVPRVAQLAWDVLL